MRYIVFSIIFCSLITSYSNAQTNYDENLVLTVEKVKNSNAKEFFFKPNTKIRIYTSRGKLVKGSVSSLLKDAIVLNTIRTTYSDHYSANYKEAHTNDIDTILLADIDWIKGIVFKNEGRKVAGGLLTLVSIPAAFFPLYAAAWGSAGLAFVLVIPVVGIMAAGISLMGPRKFQTSSGWGVKIVPNTNNQLMLIQHNGFI
ncbi:hypothetical protein [Maribellus mangrovi]|uniref:hypothetical protein n=1 Tax=Maribellus mangrovi TaxID=3133146 RepID=UPI0030EB1EE1